MRAAVYVYFSLMRGVMASAVALFFFVGVRQALVESTAFLVVLALLVGLNAQMFNQPIRSRKWIPVCLVATLFGSCSMLWTFETTSCVVCV